MQEWFDAGEIDRLWTEHEQKKRDNGLRLFGLLTVGLFLDARVSPTAFVPTPWEGHGDCPGR
jgi:hypothetical protein